MSRPAAAGLDRLLNALRDPRCYPHPVGAVELLETHISAVLLTGSFAYKIKKPVALGFVDFSSLEARRFFCEEELRLNRRTAPQLYIDVVPITGSWEAPVIDGTGAALEYALRMRQFPQDALLDSMARRGLLLPQHVEVLAHGVAAFHAAAASADAGRASAAPGNILALALENFDAIEARAAVGSDRAVLETLRAWTADEHARQRSRFEERLRDGRVRECHGDLHLRNIALLEGVPTPFDGIEFNEALRWIDVMSEAAFMLMDLAAHGLPGMAFIFLDAYLQDSGDYEGLRLLRFYSVYRALVRAKVACIRAGQAGVLPEEQARSLERYRAHLGLAFKLANEQRPALILMHGLSGSGKSLAAAHLLAKLGAVRCRSDVERKRLHGLDAAARTGSLPEAGIYSPQATTLTYERLSAIARHAIQSGYPVIVDAAFLERAERERFYTLARELKAPFAVASCSAPAPVLRERVAHRQAIAADASEAGVAILERQMAGQDALAPEESAYVLALDTSASQGLPPGYAAALAERLSLASC